ncbi:TonB-dependent receptor plug domain-containing protein [uncultured Porphyromonas sp.]|uniref:TonB-dependent receptor n=1 Tax=uncultured Porphyromonas sp. TaxID=159274 RepID=UPI002636A4A6|nr:TonB-dependent receptor plug domain-containing protein [uncultured Porphyromonas sp.]
MSLLFLLFLGSADLMAQSHSVRIQVLDEHTGDPLVAAVAHIGKKTMQTDLKGQLSLTLDAEETDGLHVHLLGYHEGFIPLKQLRATTELYTLYLHPEERSLSSVTVVGSRSTRLVNSVATKVSSIQLERNLGRSLASLLTDISGVTSLQTGTTTAKPVIHGMYGTRVLLVNNGVRLSGQQWGDDHAPEVDAESNGSIQVIKGAEAVRYGAEAIAGAIVMDQLPLPYGEEGLRGAVAGAYASNGRRLSSSVRLEGTLPGYSTLAYRLQTSYTNAGDRSSAHYLLMNTGVRELNNAFTLGWRKDRLTLEGLFSRYQNKTGLLPSGHLRSREGMAELLERGKPDLFRPFSREIGSPYHSVVHYLTRLKGTWHDERLGLFTLQGSLQQDRREEYAIRRNSAYSAVPTLSLSLSSLQLDASWRKHYHHWDSEVGLHGEYLDNYSNAGTGFTPPIPNYTQLSWGGYALQRYQADRFGLEAGLRLDRMTMSVAGYDIAGEYFSGDHAFTNLTYTLGGHLHLWRGGKMTSNVGLAFRAPHVQELYSLGSQHGSAIFVYGDRTLRSERGYKWVTSLSHHTDRWDMTLDGYLQWMDGYIYEEPSNEYAQTLAGEYPIFRYRQRDAFFRGFDLDTRYYVLPQRLYARLKGSMVWAEELKTGRYFPYIPALRLTEEVGLRLDLPKHWESELSVSHLFVDRQHRFDRSTDLTDSPDPYHLFGLEASLTKPLRGRQSLRLTLSVDNLFNTEYKEYTNRARYYAHDAGRDIRLALRWHF